MNAGQAAQALQWVEEQASLSPWDTRLIAQRAMLLSVLHRDQQALKLLDEMVGRNPNEPAAHNLVALINLNSGDLDSARTAAQRALRIDVGYVPALKTLGEIEMRLARQFYDHAARIDRGADPTLARKSQALTEVIGNASNSAFVQPGALLTLAPALPASTADMPRVARATPGAGDDAQAITVSRPPEQSSGQLPPLVALNAVPAARAGVLVSPPAGIGPATTASALHSHDSAAPPTFASMVGGVAATGFFGVPKLSLASAPNAVDTLGTPTLRGHWQTAVALPTSGARTLAATRPVAPPITTVAAAVTTTVPTTATASLQQQPAAAAPAPSQAQVDAALRQWAAAWSRRDVAGYIAAYDPEFSGRFTAANGGRAAWEKERMARIGERPSISVELSEVAISVDGDHAQTRFRQRYESGKVSSVDRKTLHWQRLPGGSWVIKREIVDS